MLTPERHLTLTQRIPLALEANGHTYLASGSTSIQIPQADIPRVISDLLVSMERIEDARDE